MRLEYFPIIVGIFVALLGVGFILDGWLPDRLTPGRERRRRARTERNRYGELLVGLGTLGMAAALLGRDTWRFGTLSVLLGTLLLAAGAWMNRDYLREVVTFRGPARRIEDDEEVPRLADTVRGGARWAARDASKPGTLRGDRETPILTAREIDGARETDAQQDTLGPNAARKRLGLRE